MAKRIRIGVASAPTEATPFALVDDKKEDACSVQGLKEWAHHVPVLSRGEHISLLEKVAALRAEGHIIYPAQQDIFRALQECAWHDVRVVILGQDPYHSAGQAHGLSFSVPDGVALPRSLRNIFREIESDLGASTTVVETVPSAPQDQLLQCMTQSPSTTSASMVGPMSGNLQRWVQQGVLLLNTVLTVEEGNAHSHAKLGWDAITRSIIESLGQRPEPIAFLLWGRHAAAYADLVAAHHLILTAAHPSPLSASRGFFGCRHFSKVNDWLQSQGRASINW
ncbi:MAG: uracil-DNA glycosylase [Pseudomonadota bacterium]